MLRDLKRLIGEIERARDALAVRSPQDAQLATLATQLHVLRAAHGVVAEWSSLRSHSRRGHLEPESHMSAAVETLRDAGEPLHVDELLRRLYDAGKVMKRGTLTSRMAKLARDGRVFKQVAPATYGLLEWHKAPHGFGPPPEAERLRRLREAPRISGRPPDHQYERDFREEEEV